MFHALEEVPHDIYAALLVVAGCALALLGHKDEAMLVLGGGLGVFKGKS